MLSFDFNSLKTVLTHVAVLVLSLSDCRLFVSSRMTLNFIHYDLDNQDQNIENSNFVINEQYN